ncbi:hypothetical protein BWD42_00845 [Sphingobacterium sp. CZ-UAM]|nr:hypothetical protein BWD42_00845 [Sphingobacterium sp. CZ-UAM]
MNQCDFINDIIAHLFYLKIEYNKNAINKAISIHPCYGIILRIFRGFNSLVKHWIMSGFTITFDLENLLNRLINRIYRLRGDFNEVVD